MCPAPSLLLLKSLELYLVLLLHHVRLYFPRKLQVTLPLPVNKIFSFIFAKLPTKV